MSKKLQVSLNATIPELYLATSDGKTEMEKFITMDAAFAKLNLKDLDIHVIREIYEPDRRYRKLSISSPYFMTANNVTVFDGEHNFEFRRSKESGGPFAATFDFTTNDSTLCESIKKVEEYVISTNEQIKQISTRLKLYNTCLKRYVRGKIRMNGPDYFRVVIFDGTKSWMVKDLNELKQLKGKKMKLIFRLEEFFWYVGTDDGYKKYGFNWIIHVVMENLPDNAPVMTRQQQTLETCFGSMKLSNKK